MNLRHALSVVLVSLAAHGLGAQAPGHRGGAPAPAPGTFFVYPERIPRQDRRLGEADRGILFVPVNRSDPTSGVLAVEVYRFRAKHETRLPPILLLEGGPGFQGVEKSLQIPGYYERVVGFFTSVADVVIVGQRGIGSSRPNTLCEHADGTDEVAIRERSTACRAFWESRGLDLHGLNVLEAAADVADAAAVLGYDQIILWGESFGSHWGMAGMRYHPEIVARAVLGSLEVPNHTYDSPTGVLNALRRIADAAEQSDELRPLIPTGGLIAALEWVIARVAEQPVTVRTRDPATGDDRTVRFAAPEVRRLASGYTGSVTSRDGARTWPADILRLYHGDFMAAARVRLEREGEGREGEGKDDYRTASYFMLDCGSGITAERLARLTTDPATHIVGDKTWWYQTSCPPWEADLGDTCRQGFETGIPTAIIHGTWDVSTPIENAVELAPHFANGKLVRIIGGSHIALQDVLNEPATGFGDALGAFLFTGDASSLPDSVVLPPVDWIVPKGLGAPRDSREPEPNSDSRVRGYGPPSSRLWSNPATA